AALRRSARRSSLPSSESARDCVLRVAIVRDGRRSPATAANQLPAVALRGCRNFQALLGSPVSTRTPLCPHGAADFAPGGWSADRFPPPLPSGAAHVPGIPRAR